MTSSVQNVVKEDGVTPADSVRRRRRLDPRRPGGQPDARLRRDVRGLRRLGDRSAAPHRPQHRERRRADDDGLDHDEADGDERHRQTTRTSQVSIDAPAGVEIIVSDKAPGKNGAERRRHDPPEEERDDRHLDHDQRSGASRTASTSAGSRSIRRRTAERRHDPGRLRTSRRATVTLTHTCTPTTFAAKTGARALHRRPSPTSAASPANVEPDGDEPRQGQGLDFTNISAPGERDQEGRRRPVERHPHAGDPAAGDAVHRHHGRHARWRLPAAVAASAIAPIAGVGDDTITNFNVPTFYYGGEPYTRDRRRLERLRRDRRRHGCGHRLHAADVPEPGTAEQRGRAVLDGPQPGRGAARSGSTYAQPAAPTTAGSSSTGPVSRTSATRRRTRSRSGSGSPSGARHGPASEQITISYGPNLTFPATAPARQRRQRRSGLRHELGRREPRRHEREEHHARPRRTAREYSVNTTPADGRRNGDDHVRRLEQAGGHVQVRSPA